MLRTRNDTSLRPLGFNATGFLGAGDVPPINQSIFALESFSGVAALGRLRHNLTRNDTNPTVARRQLTPNIVDWRDRFGVRWLTSIQNQSPCQSCWAFGATALVETQARIEHGYWDKRSEGDAHDAVLTSLGRDPSTFCDTTGSPETPLGFMVDHGVTDLQCVPYNTANQPYNPCTHRNGRTTKVPAHTLLGSVNDQKAWINLIGPIVAGLSVGVEFDSYVAGTIIRSPTVTGWRGDHIVLVVGYNDNDGYWIIRNSWGPSVGDQGYYFIGYGAINIDFWAKVGIQFTDPDPWVKARLHNGNMIHTGNGAYHKNLEVIRCDTNKLSHLWRDDTSFTWNFAPTPANLPSGGDHCVGMPALTSTTFNRNLELVYAESSGYLRHRYFSQSAGVWADGGRFGDKTVSGYPGFIQGNYGDPKRPGGNFEVVVRHNDGSLRHWWRSSTNVWSFGGTVIAKNVLKSGPSLVQANVGQQGNFYVVAVMNSGRMQMHWRNNDVSSKPWVKGEEFGSGVGRTPPVMIQSNYGTQNEFGVGNFELLVAVNGEVQHWRRDNSNLVTTTPPSGVQGRWNRVTTFGNNVRHVWSLLQGPYFQNLEAILEMNDGTLQHWFWDSVTWQFSEVLP
jgi:C1A family cysteine protease